MPYSAVTTYKNTRPKSISSPLLSSACARLVKYASIVLESAKPRLCYRRMLCAILWTHMMRPTIYNCFFLPFFFLFPTRVVRSRPLFLLAREGKGFRFLLRFLLPRVFAGRYLFLTSLHCFLLTGLLLM